MALPQAKLFGLVLTGGKSSRMGFPKAEISYHGVPEYFRIHQLLRSVCSDVYVSTSKNWSPRDNFASQIKCLPDLAESVGPLSGIDAAFTLHPNSAWVVIACDLPFFDEVALLELCGQRDPKFDATSFLGYQNRPEPLCAIYEPTSAQAIAMSIVNDKRCARGVLESMNAKCVVPTNSDWLRNVNDRSQYEQMSTITKAEEVLIEIQYVAQLREAAGKSVEKIRTNKTFRKIYEDRSLQYGFTLKPQHLRVAVNDEFVDWDALPKEHDRILFVPPVAGG